MSNGNLPSSNHALILLSGLPVQAKQPLHEPSPASSLSNISRATLSGETWPHTHYTPARRTLQSSPVPKPSPPRRWRRPHRRCRFHRPHQPRSQAFCPPCPSLRSPAPRRPHHRARRCHPGTTRPAAGGLLASHPGDLRTHAHPPPALPMPRSWSIRASRFSPLSTSCSGWCTIRLNEPDDANDASSCPAQSRGT